MTSSPIVTQEIARLRAQIDAIDMQIVELLAERFACTDAIGAAKKRGSVTVSDPARERAIVTRLAGHSTLSLETISAIYTAIFAASRKRQQ